MIRRENQNIYKTEEKFKEKANKRRKKKKENNANGNISRLL